MTTTQVSRKIQPILKKHGVKRAALFGSYARGEQRKNSDVDILLLRYPSKWSLLDLAGVQIELEDKLKKKVDLITEPSLHPILRPYIMRDLLPII